MSPRVASVALLVVASTLTAVAHADVDGAYGRLAGDMALQLDLGAGIARSDAVAHAAIALRFLQTAGIYATWSDGFHDASSPGTRSGAFGVELRPLFLARFAQDLQSGPSTLDLLIDSISLRGGLALSRNRGYEPSTPGLDLGVGFGLPLSTSASGLWLDFGATLRASHRELSADHTLPSDRFMLFTFTLGWQTIFAAHVVDAGDSLSP